MVLNDGLRYPNLPLWYHPHLGIARMQPASQVCRLVRPTVSPKITAGVTSQLDKTLSSVDSYQAINTQSPPPETVFELPLVRVAEPHRESTKLTVPSHQKECVNQVKLLEGKNNEGPQNITHSHSSSTRTKSQNTDVQGQN
jgi:hypothetical protein